MWSFNETFLDSFQPLCPKNRYLYDFAFYSFFLSKVASTARHTCYLIHEMPISKPPRKKFSVCCIELCDAHIYCFGCTLSISLRATLTLPLVPIRPCNTLMLPWLQITAIFTKKLHRELLWQFYDRSNSKKLGSNFLCWCPCFIWLFGKNVMFHGWRPFKLNSNYWSRIVHNHH